MRALARARHVTGRYAPSVYVLVLSTILWSTGTAAAAPVVSPADRSATSIQAPLPPGVSNAHDTQLVAVSCASSDRLRSGRRLHDRVVLARARLVGNAVQRCLGAASQLGTYETPSGLGPLAETLSAGHDR